MEDKFGNSENVERLQSYDDVRILRWYLKGNDGSEGFAEMVSHGRVSILWVILSDGRTWNEIFNPMSGNFSTFPSFFARFSGEKRKIDTPAADRRAKPTKVVSDWLGSWVKARCSFAAVLFSFYPIFPCY